MCSTRDRSSEVRFPCGPWSQKASRVLGGSAIFAVVLGLFGNLPKASAADPLRFPAVLPNTKPLTISKPLDEVMVDGIDKFALRELAASPARRDKLWNRDYGSRAAYAKSVAEHRQGLAKILGVVDAREKKPIFEIMAPAGTRGVRGGVEKKYEIFQVRWVSRRRGDRVVYERCEIFPGISFE